jgi:hypothetical protein
MFRAVPSPIIRSTQLYTQLQVLSTSIATGWYRGWDGTGMPLMMGGQPPETCVSEINK